MAHNTTTRRPPCPQCKRRRQRLRARSPILNTLCSPVARYGFTILAVAGLYANIPAAALASGALAAVAWRYA